jgi:ankyrin repeat protein
MKETLVDYSEKNQIEQLLALIQSGENVNVLEYGRSALHSAAMSNAIEAAELLITHNINLDLRDKGSGATALHYCAVYNRAEIAGLILTKGGRLDVEDNYGNQPLWTAIFNVKGKHERIPLVKLFLEHGANKNHKNLAGRSPHDFATQIKDSNLLKLLDGN